MRVTVLTYPGFWEPAAKGAVRALEELGYRARIRRAKGLNAYSAKVTDQKTRGMPAVWLVGSPPECVDPPHGFQVPPTQSARAKQRQLPLRPAGERTDRAGVESRGHRPGSRASAVGEDQRDIVDLAPLVPLFTPSGASVVSKRVGNYQDNPELGILFDQLWVR